MAASAGDPAALVAEAKRTYGVWRAAQVAADQARDALEMARLRVGQSEDAYRRAVRALTNEVEGAG